MDDWKLAQSVEERKFWGTLLAVGAVLTLTLTSSILLVAGSAGSQATAWFYVQQSVLLALSAAGTVVAFRRWQSFRARV